MGSRLRGSGRAGLIAALIAASLFATGLVAFAASQPAPGNYPSIVTTVRGSGFVPPCTGGTNATCAKFEFVVQRTKSGALKGRLTLNCPDGPFRGFRSTVITSLNVSGNSATFTASGKAIVRGGGASAANYSAQVAVTDGNPDTFSATVRDASNNVVCSPAGALTTVGSVIRITDGRP